MHRRNTNNTLEEKLKDHYHKRDFTPKPATVSKLGMLFTASLIFILFFESLYTLLPGIYSEVSENGKVVSRTGHFGEGYWLAFFVLLVTCVEVTWNWWRVYYDKPNWVTKELKEEHFGQTIETPAGWKHCPTCQLDAPPRSHHCNFCGHCILKRDQHCFFTSSCVGLYNQRHFVVFCLYGVWGCLMGVYLQLSYLNISYPLSDENFMMYVPPVPLFQLLIGNLSFGSFVVMLHVYVNICIMCVAGFLAAWQLLLIVRGQTSHEAWKMIRAYNAGVYTNITSVFGSPMTSWILLFAPLMLPLELDGVKWNIQGKPEKAN
ncbi:palmitoyltransferase ZDHHC22-like [Littorina saxatilis]|uniref:Palmitoyltransferase n=1 Tax=Littorina saxatilis TaxID=31220 RepID=A0AAN9BDW7_9CAEN